MKITIISQDQKYAHCLLQYILNKGSAFIEGKVLTELDTIINKEDIDDQIWIVEESVIGRSDELLIDSIKMKQVILLLEPTTTIDFKDGKAIAKYQSAHAIYEAILDTAISIQGQEIIVSQSSRTKIWLYAGLCGGVGTTSVASIHSQCLGYRGKKVFFHSLDPYSPHYEMFLGDVRYNFSDYLVQYYAEDNWWAQFKKMISVETRTNVMYFGPCRCSIDLNEFKLNDLKNWLAYLGQYSDLDYIILDVGRLSMELLLVLGDILDRIYILEETNTWSEKHMMFKKDLEMLGVGNNLNRIGCIAIGRGEKLGHGDFQRDDNLIIKDPKGQMYYNKSALLYRKIEEVIADGRFNQLPSIAQ